MYSNIDTHSCMPSFITCVWLHSIQGRKGEIQYSRNRIWSRSIFFLFTQVPDADFHMPYTYRAINIQIARSNKNIYPKRVWKTRYLVRTCTKNTGCSILRKNYFQVSEKRMLYIQKKYILVTHCLQRRKLSEMELVFSEKCNFRHNRSTSQIKCAILMTTNETSMYKNQFVCDLTDQF